MLIKVQSLLAKSAENMLLANSQTQMNNNVMAYIHLAKEKKYYKGKK